MAMASRCRLPARTGKCLVGSAASTSCVTSAPRSECRQRCGRDQRWPAAGRPQSRPARRSASGRETATGGAARQVGQHVLDRHQALVVLLERGNPFQQAARIGSSGWSNSRATGASSTMRPAYITRTRSAVSETTPMLWAMTMIAMPNSSRRSIIKVEDLRLDGDVERSGGLVFSPPLAEEVGAQHRVRAQRNHQRSAVCAFSPRRTMASHAASGVSANSNSARSAGSTMSSSTNASKFTIRRQ